MLRLFRALRLLRPFRVFFATATQIIPSVARYTTLLLCSYYFFAIIGARSRLRAAPARGSAAR